MILLERGFICETTAVHTIQTSVMMVQVVATNKLHQSLLKSLILDRRTGETHEYGYSLWKLESVVQCRLAEV